MILLSYIDNMEKPAYEKNGENLSNELLEELIKTIELQWFVMLIVFM